MIILNWVDRPILRKIHRDEFPLPDLTDPMYICCKTAIDDGNIQAVGLIRLTTEGVLITDQSLPKIARARASVAVMNALKKELVKKNIHECHIFVQDDNVAKFMQHYGFKESKGGKPFIIFF